MTYEVATSGKSTEFLWIPGHVGIDGNGTTDQLAKGTVRVLRLSLLKVPFSNIIQHLHKTILST